MAEQGWEVETKAGNGSNYLRLKDGERAIVRLLAVPVKYRQHWLKSENRSALCSKREHGACVICDSPNYTREERQYKTRFTVPVFVHKMATRLRADGKPQYDEVGEVFVWDGSQTVLATLGEVVSEIEEGWQNKDLVISRKGSGFNDTTYLIMPRNSKSDPVPNGIEVPDLLKIMSDRIADASVANQPLDVATGPDGLPTSYPDVFAEEEETLDE